MLAGVNERRSGKRQRTIAAVFGIFVAVMLLLTFFSNTMLSITLPKVTTEKARKAKLQQTIEGRGTVAAQEEAELKNDNGLGIREVLVQEGDVVKKGQTLLVFDGKEAGRQLQDEEAKLRKQRLALEKAQDNYILAQQSGDEMAAREAKRSLEMGTIDIGIQERAIQALRDKIEKQSKLVAPFDGIITQLSADAGRPPTPGQPLLRISNRDKGFKLEAEVAESSASLLKPGDLVPVRLEGADGKTKQLEGRITAITKGGQGGDGNGASLAAGSEKDAGAGGGSPRSKLVIALPGEGLMGGELGTVSVSKRSDKETLLIPNAAVREDGEGSYVFTIAENKGALGNTFTVKKSYFTKIDSNDRETAVEKGLGANELIVTESAEPLQDGNRVRLE